MFFFFLFYMANKIYEKYMYKKNKTFFITRLLNKKYIHFRGINYSENGDIY